jgi:hypothetical protein
VRPAKSLVSVFEVSYERRWDSGVFLRPYVGLIEILNAAAGVCTQICAAGEANAQPNEPLLYWGLAIGYAQ